MQNKNQMIKLEERIEAESYHSDNANVLMKGQLIVTDCFLVGTSRNLTICQFKLTFIIFLSWSYDSLLILLRLL